YKGNQDPVADRFAAGNKHGKPVYPDSKATSRWHTVLKSEQKFLVDVLLLFARLFHQTPSLNERIIQLAVTWRDLYTVDNQFKNVDKRAVFCILFGQRNQLFRTRRTKQGLHRFFFDDFLKHMLRHFEVRELR